MGLRRHCPGPRLTLYQHENKDVWVRLFLGKVRRFTLKLFSELASHPKWAGWIFTFPRRPFSFPWHSKGSKYSIVFVLTITVVNLGGYFYFAQHLQSIVCNSILTKGLCGRQHRGLVALFSQTRMLRIGNRPTQTSLRRTDRGERRILRKAYFVPFKRWTFISRSYLYLNFLKLF